MNVHRTEHRGTLQAAEPPADPDRNIKLGIRIRDRGLALTIGGYFRSLIDRDLLKPLPLWRHPRGASWPLPLAILLARSPAPAPFLPLVLEETGAGEGIRTLDPNLGKVVLYH